MRTILLCVNARLLKTRARRRIDQVRRVFLAGGCRVEVVATTPLDAGPSLTRAMLDAIAPDTVIVCGGDGTVFDALQTLAGTAIALGVVPFGTGNILAQNLHIHGSATAIATALLKARPRAVRLGSITVSRPAPVSHYFVCAAGVGPHAAVLKIASPVSKGIAGKAAYWLAGIQSWLRRSPATFTAEVTNSDGVTSTWRVCEALALRVAAINVWRAGGALHSAHLRLAMVPQTNRIGFAAAVSRAILATEVAEVATDDELQRLLRRNQDVTPLALRDASVFYQDVVRLVCRPIAANEQAHSLGVQADGEVLESDETILEMSDQCIDLLIPDFSAAL